MNESRRNFLKRGAATGALVWAAPAITSVTATPAWAVTPQPGECACASDAFGLRVIIPPLGIDQTFGEDGCVADTGVLGSPGTATVDATVVCGTTTASATKCTAEASIATLDVVVGPTLTPTFTVRAEVLTSNATAECPCPEQGTSGSATIAILVVNNIQVDPTACNADVLGLGLVTLNEQTCSGETLSVNALHINLPGIVEVIVAHSEASATGCQCNTCGPS